jgi:hypothetical protein
LVSTTISARAEHVRVLERLVLALGHGQDHGLRALAQVEQRGADQVADVLDQQQRAARRIQRRHRGVDHLRVQVAARARVDLDDGRARRRMRSASRAVS